jgi:hypothetical protein
LYFFHCEKKDKKNTLKQAKDMYDYITPREKKGSQRKRSKEKGNVEGPIVIWNASTNQVSKIRVW